MFALSDRARLADLLEHAGFLDIEIEPVAIHRTYASVVDWLGETLDLSRAFAAVWSRLGDAERQALREHVAAAAVEYTDDAGALDLPGSSLAASAAA
jgi:hypothetical protein